jgi:hypothetical protein
MRLLRTTATVAVLAAFAGSGVGIASAGETKTRTTLGIRAAKSAVFPGGSDRISGQLRAAGVGPVAGATVSLAARPAGAESFTEIASKATGERGGVGFVVTPTTTTRYALVFAGDESNRSSRSGVVRVAVRQRIETRLGIRLASSSVSPGGSDIVRGRLHTRRHGLPGRTVALVARTAATPWTAVSSATTGRYGGVHFTVTPAETTRYALVFHRTQRLAGTRSRVVVVHVGEPTSLTIAVATKSIDPGDSDSVSGVLASAGEPLAGQTVLLRARPAGAEQGSTIDSAETGADGGVAFTVTPVTTTHYRLVFRRTADYQRTVSDPGAVIVRRPTSLSIRVRDDSITAGATDVVSGSLRTPRRALPRRLVTLLARPAGTEDWTVVGSRRTGRHGFVAFRVQPGESVDYELAFGPTARYQACHSGVVTVTVS